MSLILVDTHQIVVNLPDNIDDWTIGTITDILHEGYYETNTLEFKEDISADNGRIGKTCCAFANTNDGVLIFGVSDNRNLKHMERISGLKTNQDNIVKITNQIKNIVPEIPSNNVTFSKSPIKFNGGEIILLKIIKTPSIHQYDDKFYKRLTGTNALMAYQEIKDQFISKRKNKRTLILLRQDLGILRWRMEKLKKSSVEVQIEVTDILDTQTSKHFLFNQAYLYSYEIQDKILRIIKNVDKLRNYKIIYTGLFKQTDVTWTKEFLEDKKEDNVKDYILNKNMNEINQCIERINELEQIMDVKMIKPMKQT